MIYFDSSALLKFVKPEAESAALRDWRAALASTVEMVTSALARLEVARTLYRVGVEPQRVPHIAAACLQGVYVVDLSSTVLARAEGYGLRRLGSLDAIHLATADPFRIEVTDFVTYDAELAVAAMDAGFVVTAPA